MRLRPDSRCSAIALGFDDVTICLDRSSREVRYDLQFWTLAKFHIFLSFGITAILTFLALSHLIEIYLFPDFEYPSDFEISVYIIPAALFWGLIWPWILVYKHKDSAAERLAFLLKVINPPETVVDPSPAGRARHRYSTYGFWRPKLIWFLLPILVILLGETVYQRWRFGAPHFANAVLSTLPDGELPRRQETRHGVDLVTTTPDDFPGFLGKDRRCAVEHVRLDPDWGKRPPQLLWRKPVGGGWSAFSTVNGFAVTMEQRGPEEQITCYALRSGEHHWTASWNERFINFDECPRSTPTIAHGKVFALGAWGRLVCVNGSTGKVIWSRDLLVDLGITRKEEQEMVHFGRSNSPLVTDRLVVVPGGGTPGKCASLLAYDIETGDLQWKGGHRPIGYSSPVLAELLGAEQILTVNEDAVSGHDPATGAERWSYPWPSSSAVDANVSQSVPLPGNRVLLSKGYRQGAALIELSRPEPGGAIQVREVWRNADVLRSKFSNLVVWQGHVYGLSDARLECVALETGERRWREGRYGNGQVLRVGDLLLVQNERGKVSLVHLSPETPNDVRGSVQALTGRTWNTIALYGSILLVRNSTEAACYELPLVEP